MLLSIFIFILFNYHAETKEFDFEVTRKDTSTWTQERSDGKLPDNIDLYNITFWRELAPTLHICDNNFATNYNKLHGIQSISNDEMIYVRKLVLREGYAQLDKLNFNLNFGELTAIMDAFALLKIPMVVSFSPSSSMESCLILKNFSIITFIPRFLCLFMMSSGYCFTNCITS